MLPLHFSKTSPTYGGAYRKSTFFVYPPERGEIGQSLPRLAGFQDLFRQVETYQIMFYFIIAFRQPYQTT